MPEETAKEALQSLVAVCITFLILNSFFVILRFISRFHVKQQKVGWDDILIIAGYVANIGLCVDAFGTLSSRRASMQTLLTMRSYLAL